MAECSCGRTIKPVRLTHLKTGHSSKCRQCSVERKDGLTQSGLGKSHYNMMRRCYNNLDKDYATYGLLGIRVDVAWHDIRDFHSDMVATWYDGATLDRIDNRLGYSKGNCQWLSKSEHGYKTALDVKYRKK